MKFSYAPKVRNEKLDAKKKITYRKLVALIVLVILMFTGCGVEKPVGPIKVTEIQAYLDRRKLELPVYTLRQGTEYDYLEPTFYYYGGGDFPQLEHIL